MPATERATLHPTHARTLDKMNRLRDVLMAVGIANDQFAIPTPPTTRVPVVTEKA